MKKLLLVCCVLMPSLGLTDSLDEIVVTASPLGKSVDELVKPINVLSGDELEREVAATIGETLNNQLGINSGSFGPGVGVPVVRGQSGNRVEILQNSTKVQDASDTSFDHAVSAEPLLADTIEVLRGPAILRYGNGAIGGVINIIDNRIPQESINDTSGALQLRFNHNNDERVVVGRIDSGNGTWAFHADAVYRESNNISIPGLADRSVDDDDETSDEFIENTHSDGKSGSIGLAYTGQDFLIGASINKLDTRYGIPPGAHGEEEEGEEEEEEEEEGERVDIDLDQTRYEFRALRSNLAGSFLDKLSAEISYTDYEHVEIEIEGGEAEIGTSFDVDAIDTRFEAIHKSLNGWDGAIGLQYTTRDFSAVGEEAFVPPSETQEIGLYLIEERSFSFADLELGARISSNTIERSGASDIDHDTFNFSAALTREFDDRNKFSVAFVHAERAPTAEELLSDGVHVATNSFELGVATLDTEESNSIELNYQFNADVFEINASVYHTDFSDFIYQERDGTFFSEATESCEAAGAGVEEEIACFTYAQEDATFTGFEIEGIWQLNDSHEVRLWSDAVRAELDNSGDVPRTPALRIGADWDYTLGAWRASIGIKYTDDQDRPGNLEEETDGNTNVDLSLSHRLDRQHIFLNVTNVFDEDIRNATSFIRETAPEPGRAITAGVSWHF